MMWECNLGHKWEANYGGIRQGNWCKICSQKLVGVNRRTSIEYFHNYAKENGGFCLSETYETQSSKLDF